MSLSSGHSNFNHDFAALLRHYIQVSLYTYGQLAQLSGVPKRTFVNWLDGTTKQPRYWQSVVRVTAALRLTRRQVDGLLIAAGLPTLAELETSVDVPEDRALLDYWRVESWRNNGGTDVAADVYVHNSFYLRRYLESLSRQLVTLPVYFPRQTALTFRTLYQDVQLRRMESEPPTDAAPMGHAPSGVPWSTVREQHRRVVLLGQPGMGKSWLLKAEALQIASKELAQEGGEPYWLPILVRMPELVTHLQGQHGGEMVCRALAELAARAVPELPEGEVAEALEHFLARHAERVVLLLDALDEVPGRDAQRTEARRIIVQLGASMQARIVLASRVLGYLSAPMGRYLGNDVAEYELLPFTNREIMRVIRVWFHDQREKHQRLSQAMRRAPALARQAGNPLLLNLMCMLTETRGAELTGDRSGLYEPVLRLILEGVWRSFEMQLPESRVRAKLRVLEVIAWCYATYRQSWWEQLPGDVLEGKLELLPDAQRLWSTWHAEWGMPYEGPLWELSEWDGILVKGEVAIDGGVSAVPYAFLHRTFQEFLVARFLLRRYFAEGLDAPEVQEFLASKATDPEWHIVHLLLVELLARQDLPDVQPLLSRLSDVLMNSLHSGSGQMSIAAVEILLALHQTEVGSEVVRALRDRLCDTMRDTDVLVTTRVQAARMVSELGDPRAEVLEVDAIDFVDVPGGEFWAGSDLAVDTEATHEEFPLHQRSTGPFALSCYPISNAQYRMFLMDSVDGFDNPANWTEAIALGHWQDGRVWRVHPHYQPDGTIVMEPTWSRDPHLFGWPTDLPNFPIFGISWYEARAFVRWLERRWRKSGKIGAQTRLGLPTEFEWEKAARGTDGRIYPWGNTFDGNRLNWYGHMLMSPAAIGAFPHSTSPYGLEEMIGNLWEWTRSVFAPYDPEMQVDTDFERRPQPEVKLAIRGGAYFSMRARCRCAARSATLPYGRVHVTFRVAKYEGE